MPKEDKLLVKNLRKHWHDTKEAYKTHLKGIKFDLDLGPKLESFVAVYGNDDKPKNLQKARDLGWDIINAIKKYREAIEIGVKDAKAKAALLQALQKIWDVMPE